MDNRSEVPFTDNVSHLGLDVTVFATYPQTVLSFTLLICESILIVDESVIRGPVISGVIFFFMGGVCICINNYLIRK